MAQYRKQDAKAWAREHVRNQWTTLITPFTPDDEIDEASLRKNIRHIQSLGTAGAGCSWNMGEFWALTREERIRLMEIVADESRAKWHIAAQVTHTSYKEAIALAHQAEALGYDLLILAAPYMVTKTEKAVIEFTKLVAEQTNLGIMFYNSPQFGVVMSAQGLQEICRIPNVMGVKEASFNKEISLETHKLLGKDAVISTPDEWIYWAAQEQGFELQQVMFANTSDWRFDLPGRNHYVQFINQASTGKLDDAFYATHLKAIKDLSDRWWMDTVKKAGGVLPLAMCKYWGELMGMAGGHPRLPILDMAPEDKAQLKQELEAVLTPDLVAGG
ncbi:MAG: dihydrodipicolinate synthase family protein [Dehalococcoidia bacterium]|nr:dihydrodipicolinate synthase family protein [Dehalococcoidia bacterium]